MIYVVWYYVYYFFIGIFFEVYVIIVWFKIVSYVFINCDFCYVYFYFVIGEFDVFLELYRECFYFNNIIFMNLVYFWWVLILIY